ncbi:MAG: hypothetical protein HY899_01400 [Deltaproteobacteria bacterium]|nr:hypothetical protein [Deltaproteobacteria bacterium]
MTDIGRFTPTAADEGRHTPGSEELWGESWYCDWSAPDCSYGGYVRLGLYPNLGRAWWWIALVGAGRPLVLTVEHELRCPQGEAALDQKVAGTSFALSCTEAFRRMRVSSSATGVVLPDPAKAFYPLDGKRLPVSLDLTWVSRAEVFPYAMATRYELSSWVTGSVTVGDETIAVDCAGQRDHSWGVRDWWLFPWNWTAGHFDDGSYMHAARSILPEVEIFATGYTVTPDGVLTETARVDNAVDIDSEKLPTAARQRIGDIAFAAEPIGHAPVLLVAPDGRQTRFPRAMCRYTTTDGRVGSGWTEYNWPPGFP